MGGDGFRLTPPRGADYFISFPVCDLRSPIEGGGSEQFSYIRLFPYLPFMDVTSGFAIGKIKLKYHFSMGEDSKGPIFKPNPLAPSLESSNGFPILTIKLSS